jgi:hypothetical protein
VDVGPEPPAAKRTRDCHTQAGFARSWSEGWKIKAVADDEQALGGGLMILLEIGDEPIWGIAWMRCEWIVFFHGMSCAGSFLRVEIGRVPIHYSPLNLVINGLFFAYVIVVIFSVG